MFKINNYTLLYVHGESVKSIMLHQGADILSINYRLGWLTLYVMENIEKEKQEHFLRVCRSKDTICNEEAARLCYLKTANTTQGLIHIFEYLPVKGQSCQN